MKAVQIQGYSKTVSTVIRNVPIPVPKVGEVLVKVKTAAVNPVDLLILTGSLKLIFPYKLPLTLGNECAGTVEKVGEGVTDFQPGDLVYARLPASTLGGFAEYVTVNQSVLAKMPEGCSFDTAAAIPLTGLTAYQALTEELEAQAGKTVFIPGGSGSFGEMAVPLAKSMGLQVIVSGSGKAEEHFRALGVDQYLDYRKEQYWETISPVDYIIDTLGEKELAREFSVLKPGGRLVSLRALPNGAFAKKQGLPFWKRALLSLAGARLDRLAGKQGKEYRFLFVRADGEQLKKITQLVETRSISPRTDSRIFTLDQAQQALELVAQGRTNGKVLLKIS